jgi:hypothetical protein
MKTIDYLKQLSEDEIFTACLSLLNVRIDSRDVDSVIDILLNKVELEDSEDPIGYSDMYPIIKYKINEQFREARLLMEHE